MQLSKAEGKEREYCERKVTLLYIMKSKMAKFDKSRKSGIDTLFRVMEELLFDNTINKIVKLENKNSSSICL